MGQSKKIKVFTYPLKRLYLRRILLNKQLKEDLESNRKKVIMLLKRWQEEINTEEGPPNNEEREITKTNSNNQLINMVEDKMHRGEFDSYPIVLTAKEISRILLISKPTAYEIMERNDFPLIRIGRCKRVMRDEFFTWLSKYGATDK